MNKLNIKKTFKFISCLFFLLFSQHQLIAADISKNNEFISVSSFKMPKVSSYWSDETKEGMFKQQKMMDAAFEICMPWHFNTQPEIRDCENKIYPTIIKAAEAIYSVEVTPMTISGIEVDIVTPKEGLSVKNKSRVLINLHGGAFKFGSRYGGQLEAMPLAAIGKFKVVAVNYSKAPEHIYPQAVKDVVAVYQELLKQYDAQQVAIYGCSAGSRLTGEVVAWLHTKSIPLPGAIGLLCSPPTRLDGDSNYFAAAMKGQKPLTISNVEYWEGVSPTNPIAFPGESLEMLSIFPPSILMTSTRDYSLSPMVAMHQKLIKQGKTSELHIFEGFAHAEFLSMYIPEATHVANLLTAFFNEHLNNTN
uniref:alpha/beta hydrolase n=1 Tax=Shewanella gaetbuli TaxID=220752 RepID=UPI003B5A07EE